MTVNSAAEFESFWPELFPDQDLANAKKAQDDKKNNEDFFQDLQTRALIARKELFLRLDQNIRAALDEAISFQQEKMADDARAQQNQQRSTEEYAKYLKNSYAQATPSSGDKNTPNTPSAPVLLATTASSAMHPSVAPLISHWEKTVWQPQVKILAAKLTQALTNPLTMPSVPVALQTAAANPTIQPQLQARATQAKETIQTGLEKLPSAITVVAQNSDSLRQIHAEYQNEVARLRERPEQKAQRRLSKQEAEQKALAKLAEAPAVAEAARVYEMSVQGLIASVMRDFYQDAFVIADQADSPEAESEATTQLAVHYVEQNRGAVANFVQGTMRICHAELNQSNNVLLNAGNLLFEEENLECAAALFAEDNEENVSVQIHTFQSQTLRVYPNSSMLFPLDNAPKPRPGIQIEVLEDDNDNRNTQQPMRVSPRK